MSPEKRAKKERRLRLRKAILNYLTTVSPMRRYSTDAQLRAAAKQMEQANRIPVAVANAIAVETKRLEELARVESERRALEPSPVETKRLEELARVESERRALEPSPA